MRVDNYDVATGSWSPDPDLPKGHFHGEASTSSMKAGSSWSAATRHRPAA